MAPLAMVMAVRKMFTNLSYNFLMPIFSAMPLKIAEGDGKMSSRGMAGWWIGCRWP
jgi:hypothetical protein